MQQTFFQKAVLTIMAGIAAAGLLWVYRHIIEESRRENAEGWRDIFVTPKPK